MFEYRFELMRIGAKNLHINFSDTALEHLTQDFQVFGAEFQALHISLHSLSGDSFSLCTVIATSGVVKSVVFDA
jgi:hypothetical protein